MNKQISLKKTWYANGSLKEMFYVVNNIRNGEYKKFDENGRLMVECVFKSGKICGVLKETTEGEYRELHYANGKRHGSQFEYVDDWLVKKYNCKNGKLHGEYIKYNSKGIPEIACHMLNGALDGKLFFWDIDKVLRAEYNYKNGKMHGECTLYEKDSYVVGNYRNGRPIKRWKECDKSGKMLRSFISSRMLSKALFESIRWDISM